MVNLTLQAAQSGLFRCLASNSEGSAQAIARFIVSGQLKLLLNSVIFHWQ